jgi:predicted DNA-binding transcriptional regulator AlpA
MPDPLAGLPPRFLRTPEAARYLGLSGRTLEKHRTYGTGPKYRKIGGRVVYALDDLKVWADLGAGAVAWVVGIEGGVVSGVINLESSGVGASDWRPRHEKHYQEVWFLAACS